ncbi:hypothetical protein [Aeromonas caviae]|uniref:hypothetical protein n=1 Tax=Aeromonas caviae TaxID=648 RepID=UPI001CC4491F|nr:hypothetical protein [Aeromonas caviae]GJA77578.1 hypothetical protein KAM354_28140 [Aeromonas caviae]HDT5889345.1 hypothetical protein [Aeromonas dhakensis]HEB4980340.1 hypothetical protein [Aeromonas dhakensis]
MLIHPMTLLNRLIRLFGGYAADQAAPRDLLLTCEQIRQHLAQGGEPACWLAWSVVSSYRPPTWPTISIGFSVTPSREALALFERLVMIRSARLPPRQQDWDESDERLATLVEECVQYLTSETGNKRGMIVRVE